MSRMPELYVSRDAQYRCTVKLTTDARHSNRKRRYALVRRITTAAIGTAVLMGTLGMNSKPIPSPSRPAAVPAHRSGTQIRAPGPGPVVHACLREQPLPVRKATTRRAPRVSVRTQRRWRKYHEMVEFYAARYQLPPELIFAVIERESAFNPRARSDANAVGLMQIIPHEGGRAASRLVKKHAVTPTLQELYDPQTNIQLGAAYLRLLLDTYFSNIRDEDMRLAIVLAAYNWGPGNVLETLDDHGVPKTMKELDRMLRKHAPKETRNYVRGIRQRMDVYS